MALREPPPSFATPTGRLRVTDGGRGMSEHLVAPVRPSPCTGACPAGVNVKAYVGLIAARRFQDALDVIRLANPLPGICGRICHHPCEAACLRGAFDEPLAIRALKRFAADYEGRVQEPPAPAPAPRVYAEEVSIVGSGPAGLTAAHDLVLRGYGVTVYEAAPEAGGMLTYGIPDFRLPREIVRNEIERIESLGVRIETGVRVGRDRDLQALARGRGRGAVFLAVGSQRARMPGIPGEGARGVVDCLTFMRRANGGDPVLPGRRTVVIGGGHSAMDCARTAWRLGADSVEILYRRSLDEMPADREDVEETQAEGVTVTCLVSPVEILRDGDSGRVTGIRCVRNRLGPPDESGRPRPVPMEDSTFDLPVETIIPAVGQDADLLGFEDLSGGGRLSADPDSLATPVDGVFAGGDVVTGPATVIDAIAQGHRAARSIHRYLRGGLAGSGRGGPGREEIEIPAPPPAVPQGRPAWRSAAAAIDRRSFEEVDAGLCEDDAVREAARCLRCGPCSECPVCLPTCELGHLFLTPDGGSALRVGRVFRASRRGPALPGPGEERQAVVADASGKEGERHTLSATTCRVDEAFCRACGRCGEVCDYGAVTMVDLGEGRATARIDPLVCRGCGVCASQCITNAIVATRTADHRIERMLEEADGRTVAFSCNWNTAAVEGRVADLFAEKEPLVIPTMCAGRIDPGLVLRAFAAGAARVALVRCVSAACHYGFGGHVAGRNLEAARDLARLMGIDGERLTDIVLVPDGEGDRDGAFASAAVAGKGAPG